jgi:hypothetical protein
LAKVTLTSNGLNFIPNSTKTTSFRIVPVKYDLWIGDIQVTESNCTDILGDGSADQGKAASFQYVPSLNKLFITNNTEHRMSAVRLLLRYTTMQGELLTQRAVTVPVKLLPGETQLVSIKSFDVQRLFYYYAGPQPRKSATPFQVAYRLTGYDIQVGN